MMSQEANDLITRTGRKDPCGKLMRMYWQPAALVGRVARAAAGAAGQTARREPRAVSRRGRPLRPDRPPLRASRRRPRLRPSGKRRAALCLPWLAVRRIRPMPGNARRAEGLERCARASGSAPIPWSRRAASSGLISAKASRRRFRRSTVSSRPTAIPLRSRATSTATGCRRSKSASIRRTPRSCIASSRTRIRPLPTASSSAAPPPDSDMPMTKILREYDNPIINVEHTEYGLRLIALREIDEERTHVRVTNQLFPHGFVIPMSTEMTITQWHVPVDDENCYWYAIFTQLFGAGRQEEDARPAARIVRAAGLQIAQEQEQRLRLRSARTGDRDLYRHGGRHQRPRPVGGGIDGRDPGPHQRASRHLGQGDRAVSPPAAAGDRERSPAARSRSCSSTPRMRAASRARRTMDGIGPTRGWEIYWMEVDVKRRRGAVGRAGAERDRRQDPAFVGGGVMVLAPSFRDDAKHRTHDAAIAHRWICFGCARNDGTIPECMD